MSVRLSASAFAASVSAPRPVLPDELQAHAARIADFIYSARGRLAVLTGAGLSTDSDIPDYRGANGIYTRNAAYKPIMFQEFATRHGFRQRYWARSYYGYPKMLTSKPNKGHLALAKLHDGGLVHPSGLVTQNVDGLQQKAGAAPEGVIELHGTLSTVGCLSCGHTVPREWVQEQLAEMNPAWRDSVPLPQATETLMGAQHASEVPGTRDQGTGKVNPDGDLDLVTDFSSYRYPDCPHCRAGILKPSVTFFGENIPVETKNLVSDVVAESDALLVIGTSLATYSALRIVKQAVSEGKPVGILNIGETRGDSLATWKLQVGCGQALPLATEMLIGKLF